MRVPETPMDHHQGTSSGKHDIGAAGQFAIMEAVAVASGEQGTTNPGGTITDDFCTLKLKLPPKDGGGSIRTRASEPCGSASFCTSPFQPPAWIRRWLQSKSKP